jgi:hypothetical protein
MDMCTNKARSGLHRLEVEVFGTCNCFSLTNTRARNNAHSTK